MSKLYVLYQKVFGYWTPVLTHKDINVVKMHEKRLRDDLITTWIDVVTEEEFLGYGA